MSSGIADTLLEIFNEEDVEAATEARSDFLKVFMTTRNLSNLATGDSNSPVTAFSVLVHKLQDLLSRSEHFEVVTVHHNAFENNSRSAASMLAKQLRLRLMADDDSGIPRPYRNIMVSIHAIATFKALDDYLRPRLILADRPRNSRNTDRIAAYAAALAEGRTPGHPPTHPPSLGMATNRSSSSSPCCPPPLHSPCLLRPGWSHPVAAPS